MKQLLLTALLAIIAATATAGNRDIDISGNNTSSSYVSYSTGFSIAAADTVNVKMARYCYFSSTITGSGTLNLYCGGERCYLGTEKGKAWPVWTSYKGDIHIWPFKSNAPSAGFYGVVLAHGGKSSSAENALDDAKSGKVNPSMANNRVTLHSGATICCEANTAGAGFRIGHLDTEEGSFLQGYMKNQRAAYYLLGGMNTDATLAGTIRPSDYRDDTSLGIVKEGTGTLRITGNDNYLSGALRILSGRVLISNDRQKAQQQKKRGALGARPNSSEAIAYVFEGGILGGTGSIGGSVDNYGIIEPGADTSSVDNISDAIGTLTLQNYASTSLASHLTLHPASVLRFKMGSAGHSDQLAVNGSLKYDTMQQDFTTSDKQPVVELTVLSGFPAEVGYEFTLLTAKSKSGDWQFELKQPGRYTWELVEHTEGNTYTLVARITSLNDSEGSGGSEGPDNPEQPGMGPYYDDGISDAADTHSLRYYAEKCGKYVGVALCTYKGYQSDRDEGGKQFNMMVAENEMKMDALQPSQGQYTFGSADALVSFAQRNQMRVRGHCLVWHQQQPEWLSSDGKKNDKHWTRQQALDIMRDHITTVVTHFKGKVKEWDVVNECLDDDQSIVRTNPDAYTLRQNVWQQAIGDDYIDSAFVYARRADPNAVLYLNDYDVEHQGKAKAVAFYNLAKRLRSKNIPVDGVGLQCHFSVGEVDSVKLDATVKRFGEDGMKCIITELDMGVPNTSAQNLEEQARLYRVITDIMLKNDNCPDMVIWGLKDNDSWRSASNPLLYTAGMERKPAWRAVRSALRHSHIATGIDSPIAEEQAPLSAQPSRLTPVYNMQGIAVGTADSWQRLPRGLYIMGGRIIQKQ
jgi:autotransporter-associated beta strand protein